MSHGIGLEHAFRTRKGAFSWAADFRNKKGHTLVIRRDRIAQLFGRTVGVWILEIPDYAVASWHECYGEQPYGINQ